MVRPLCRWILIADESKARVVEMIGTGVEVHAPANLVFRNAATESIDARPSKPRGQSVEARWASALSDSEAVDLAAMQRFAVRILNEISTHAAEGAFDRLVIAAPPDMLRRLKSAMPDELAGFVDHEIDGDLSRISPEGLVKAIGDRVFRLH